MTTEAVWVPQACTLPADQQSQRVAEFDDLFAVALCDPHRVTARRLRLVLDPCVEQSARDLIAREAACCSFFTFTVRTDGGELTIDIEVPAAQVAVLDDVALRASARRTAT
ncbi:MAG: hypothetical protein DLM57_04135 [Pseudonocardiales bacterium]|nr:MAG: hypothetical protein DLM57_04135 [Pseudonocardiales bacterium]